MVRECIEKKSAMILNCTVYCMVKKSMTFCFILSFYALTTKLYDCVEISHG